LDRPTDAKSVQAQCALGYVCCSCITRRLSRRQTDSASLGQRNASLNTHFLSDERRLSSSAFFLNYLLANFPFDSVRYKQPQLHACATEHSWLSCEPYVFYSVQYSLRPADLLINRLQPRDIHSWIGWIDSWPRP